MLLLNSSPDNISMVNILQKGKKTGWMRQETKRNKQNDSWQAQHVISADQPNGLNCVVDD